jgi:hypothetical protein
MKKITLFITLLLGLLCHWVIAQDYTITTTGGNLVITDNSNLDDNLVMNQDGTNIRLDESTITTKTYSIDGGAITAITTTPADIPMAGITSITINLEGGNDKFGVYYFPDNLPSLTINGGEGNDNIGLGGNLTFATDANLDVDLQNDVATPGNDIVSVGYATYLLQGTGAVTIKASQSISINGSTLRTDNGNIVLEANQQEIPITSNGIAITSNSLSYLSIVESTGTGIVTIKGKGTVSGAGIKVDKGSKVIGGTTGNSLEIIGIAESDALYGVWITDENSQITSNGGNVSVTGKSYYNSTVFGFGIRLDSYGQISAGSNGTVTVDGTGGLGALGGNYGVSVYARSSITSSGGNVNVTGQGGGSETSANNYGIYLGLAGSISAGGDGTVTVTGTGGASTGDNNHGVYITGIANSVTSKISSSSGAITITGTKGSSTNSTAADIIMNASGQIISTSTTAGITLNATTSGVFANTTGNDISTDATQTVALGTNTILNFDIDGTTVDTEYQQLNLIGQINLNSASIQFNGSTYTAIGGETFTIINNDGTDAIVGTFAGLAEGAIIEGFLESELDAKISYVGGDGNDVVLTVTPVIIVTVQDASKIYGEENPTFSVSYSGFQGDDDESILMGTLSITTEATTSSNAGEYDIVASGLSAEGYEIEFEDGTLTIEKADLTVKVNDSEKLVDTANPTFSVTYTGFVNGDDADDLTGTLMYETEAITSSPAGDYPVSASGLSSDNYEITYQEGTLTISAISCEPITGLSAEAGISAFTLSWDAKEGVSSYTVKVYLATTIETLIYSATITSNSWSKNNIITTQDATEYKWTVEANTDGVCATGTTLAIGENFIVYPCVEGFTSTSSKGGINSFELVWTSVPNVTSYTVKIYYANGFLYNTFSTASTIIKESNIPDGNYFWTVTINTTCGASEVYGGTFRVLSCTIMNNLSGLSAIGGNKSFTLYWNQLAGDFTGSYRVNFRIRMKGTSTWTYTGKTGGTSYTRTSVPAGTYEWELQAYLFGAPNSCSGSWKKGNDFVVSSSGAAVRESDEVFETDVLAEGIEVINFGAEEKEIMTETFLDFTVFPNPSRGIVSFNLGSFEGVGKLEIFNLMGQVVYSQEVSAGEQIQNKDFSAQAKGMYIVRLSANGNVQTQKFVIE